MPWRHRCSLSVSGEKDLPPHEKTSDPLRRVQRLLPEFRRPDLVRTHSVSKGLEPRCGVLYKWNLTVDAPSVRGQKKDMLEISRNYTPKQSSQTQAIHCSQVSRCDMETLDSNCKVQSATTRCIIMPTGQSARWVKSCPALSCSRRDRKIAWRGTHGGYFVKVVSSSKASIALTLWKCCNDITNMRWLKSQWHTAKRATRGRFRPHKQRQMISCNAARKYCRTPAHKICLHMICHVAVPIGSHQNRAELQA